MEEHIPDAQLFVGASGQDGLIIYEKENPDLIVTDLLMPLMTGQEFITIIRKTDLLVKIIVITADIQKTVREEIEALGVIAFVNKPLTGERIEQLFNTIKGCFHV